jgi:hypothetical protein
MVIRIQLTVVDGDGKYGIVIADKVELRLAERSAEKQVLLRHGATGTLAPRKVKLG